MRINRWRVLGGIGTVACGAVLSVTAFGALPQRHVSEHRLVAASMIGTPEYETNPTHKIPSTTTTMAATPTQADIAARAPVHPVSRSYARPAPPPVAVQPPPSGSCEQRWYSLFAQYPWPVAVMENIMCHHESGGDPNAVNRVTKACGLLQLLPCPPGGLDPATNVNYAYNEKYVPACKRGDCLSPWGR